MKAPALVLRKLGMRGPGNNRDFFVPKSGPHVVSAGIAVLPTANVGPGESLIGDHTAELYVYLLSRYQKGPIIMQSCLLLLVSMVVMGMPTFVVNVMPNGVLLHLLYFTFVLMAVRLPV